MNTRFLKILVGFYFCVVAMNVRGAVNIYISDFQKIPLRESPGFGSKVLRMISTDTRVIVLEGRNDWSKITIPEANMEGWVQSKTLSYETPVRMKLLLAQKNLEAERAKSQAQNENAAKLSGEILKLKEDLNLKSGELQKLSSEYEELVKQSGNVVKLQKDYKKAALQINEYYMKNQELESQMNNYYLYWFLAGAGTLFMGLWLGRRSQRGHYTSNLKF